MPAAAGSSGLYGPWQTGPAVINAFVPRYSAPRCLQDSESISHLQAQILTRTKDISVPRPSPFKTRFLRRTPRPRPISHVRSFSLCFSGQSLEAPCEAAATETLLVRLGGAFQVSRPARNLRFTPRQAVTASLGLCPSYHPRGLIGTHNLIGGLAGDICCDQFSQGLGTTKRAAVCLSVTDFCLSPSLHSPPSQRRPRHCLQPSVSAHETRDFVAHDCRFGSG